MSALYVLMMLLFAPALVMALAGLAIMCVLAVRRGLRLIVAAPEPTIVMGAGAS